MIKIYLPDGTYLTFERGGLCGNELNPDSPVKATARLKDGVCRIVSVMHSDCRTNYERAQGLATSPFGSAL